MKDRVLQFIERSMASREADRPTEQEFSELALQVFERQFELVVPYRRFCEARGVRPGDARSVEQIPAIPSDLFKHPLILEPSGPNALLFESSGTTAGPEKRSRHLLSDPDTYRASALSWFSHMVLPDRPGPMQILVLGPSAASHPRSSLGQMFSWCVEEFGGDVLFTFDDEGGLALDPAIHFLLEAEKATQPVMILAVTTALTRVFNELRQRRLALRLPADSRIVDTGGPKGGPCLSAKGVLKAAWTRLHIPAWACINEYGMTEMLSQFYDDAMLSRVDGSLVARSKLSPPWCHTRVVAPGDLSPLAPGEVGLLAHFDLANWETVSALQTLDSGKQNGRGYALLGRAPLAETRGCSQLLAVASEALSTK